MTQINSSKFNHSDLSKTGHLRAPQKCKSGFESGKNLKLGMEVDHFN